MAKYGSTGMADRDQSQLDATRAQVNEVQNIMKVNVDKIMEREAKLCDLEGRADQLKAFQFKNLASFLKVIYSEKAAKFCEIFTLLLTDK